MTSANYRIVREAIVREQQVTCMYLGHHRLIAPGRPACRTSISTSMSMSAPAHAEDRNDRQHARPSDLPVRPIGCTCAGWSGREHAMRLSIASLCLLALTAPALAQNEKVDPRFDVKQFIATIHPAAAAERLHHARRGRRRDPEPLHRAVRGLMVPAPHRPPASGSRSPTR